jgi:hypothetical protein
MASPFRLITRAGAVISLKRLLATPGAARLRQGLRAFLLRRRPPRPPAA